MNAIIGGSQERAVYIGDNSEIVLGTNRTEAWTLDAVKELPLGTSLVMGILASDSDFAWAHPEIARQNRSDTVQQPGKRRRCSAFGDVRFLAKSGRIQRAPPLPLMTQSRHDLAR